jgi:hypothetical protein
MTSFTRNGASLEVIITDPESIGFTLPDITVVFAGQPCTVDSYDEGVITCEIPMINSIPVLEAGTQIPLIHAEQIGFSKIDNEVVGELVPLTITAVSPIDGSLNGGTVVTITGTGFPSSLERVAITGFTL